MAHRSLRLARELSKTRQTFKVTPNTSYCTSNQRQESAIVRIPMKKPSQRQFLVTGGAFATGLQADETQRINFHPRRSPTCAARFFRPALLPGSLASQSGRVLHWPE